MVSSGGAPIADGAGVRGSRALRLGDRDILEEGVNDGQRDHQPCGVLCARASHADELALDVEHGPTVIARVDGRVHLNAELT